MAFLIKRSWENFDSFMDSADERTENWFLVKSPWIVLIIEGCYIYFVNKLGPHLMKDKKPFNLKKLIIIYNIYQILFCATILFKSLPLLLNMNWKCAKVSYTYDEIPMLEAKLMWCFYMSKYVDFLDTLFFILRKKFNQVSTLHWLHHVGIVSTTWFGSKFIPGGHSFFVVVVNSFVHMVMYGYYLLTAYDENFSKNVQIKKSITQMQLIQFIFYICIYGQTLFRENCTYMPFASFYLVIQSLILLALFGDFYYRTYHKKLR